MIGPYLIEIVGHSDLLLYLREFGLCVHRVRLLTHALHPSVNQLLVLLLKLLGILLCHIELEVKRYQLVLDVLANRQSAESSRDTAIGIPRAAWLCL